MCGGGEAGEGGGNLAVLGPNSRSWMARARSIALLACVTELAVHQSPITRKPKIRNEISARPIS